MNEKKRNGMQLSRLFLHFERVYLKQHTLTAQDYLCGAVLPSKNSELLPLVVLLHSKHKTASVLKQ